jgi:hypothetical protein
MHLGRRVGLIRGQHGELGTGAAVAAASIIGCGVAIVANLTDRVVYGAVAAALGGLAILAAAVTGDGVAIVACLALIDDAVAAGALEADGLFGCRVHSWRAGDGHGPSRPI